jgi:hypothetical protein
VSDFLHPNRRGFAALLAALLSSVAAPSLSNDRKPGDNGIGGTGYGPQPRDLDNGVGGTGVVGTIRRFGSIFVNGLRVAYPQNAKVRIDGAPARASDMRIGHVVTLVAERNGDELSTERIEILREVVGPVESISGQKMRVLGQDVELDRKLRAPGVKLGEFVAVSGLRKPDQTIVASLVERVSPRQAQIVGRIARTPEGALVVGSQRLTGAPPAMVGRRAILRGSLVGGVLEVASTAADPGPPRGVKRLLLETYVKRSGSELRTAAGAGLATPRGASFPNGVTRAIIGVDVEADGKWKVRSLRLTDAVGADARGGGAGGPGGASGPAAQGAGGSSGNSGGSGGPGGSSGPHGLGGPGGIGAPGGIGGPGGGAPGGIGGPPGLGGAPRGLGGGPGGVGAPGGIGGAQGRGPGGMGPPGQRLR